MDDRIVFTIFCDDIRFEMGNKHSFMGVYQTHLFVQSFPATLPKLCAFSTIVTPHGQPLQKLSFRLIQDEQVIQEETFPADSIAVQPSPLEWAGENAVLILSSAFVISPLVVSAPSTIRIEVETETRVIRGGGLRVDLLPASQEPIDPHQAS